MKIQFSIPAYRSVVHVKTAVCLAEMTACVVGGSTKNAFGIVNDSWQLDFKSIDNPDVDYAQNLLFESAMKSECDIMLLMGSDNHAPAEHLIRMIHFLMNGWDLTSTWKADWACIAAPCPHRSGGLNVRERNPTKVADTLHHLEQSHIFEADLIGFGIAAFRLAWYREQWKEGSWLRSTIYNEGGNLKRISQDYAHCEEVRRRNGIVLADARFLAGHEIDMRGNQASSQETQEGLFKSPRHAQFFLSGLLET